jgi:3-methyladenine DNA glycosylase AlkD
MTTVGDVMQRLETMRSDHDREGMSRFGINTTAAYGISIYELRRIAREIGTDHGLALDLWDTGMHEARILAVFVAAPAKCSRGR